MAAATLSTKQRRKTNMYENGNALHPTKKMRRQTVIQNDNLVPERPTYQSDNTHTVPPKTNDVAFDIYSRLPRELRNRIYTFCVEGSYDNDVIVRRTAVDDTHRFAYLIREPCGQHSYQWVEDPLTACLKREALGGDVAREMLESYYWTRTFKFAHHELCLLGPFLRTDVFGLGIIPAHYIRRLQIQIRPLDFAFLLPAQRRSEEEQCCKAVEALAAIRTTRTDILIELDEAQDSLSDAEYKHFSSEAAQFTLKLRSVVETLREQGLHIIQTMGT
ncbi:hypothetical protein Ptr902_06970 [Pyrenophora tritici-repentis]|uniref:Uncharacterized protein n=1 Tax=Pyrenophora tritici-repentis TaxID=45151 RepID=A0A922N7Y0_9PLEO|nr:hypothetical protein A1F99_082710 [Pyrenophora tritici-repentis]KAI0588614.1 hypothetical protein Alg215_00798 [Pyrenophora tritici-repentis]KAI0591011.1 hypothetical protein Alg130_01741 [Pyrenophora tritici-repentis]KAI0614891.1 hypothetical protein TUN205_00885 [Pyrenophora tritici-repentis]KAI0626117.1 hypothetical protein TUN199_01931 [Pyrenophora tritici-repentis]